MTGEVRNVNPAVQVAGSASSISQEAADDAILPSMRRKKVGSKQDGKPAQQSHSQRGQSQRSDYKQQRDIFAESINETLDGDSDVERANQGRARRNENFEDELTDLSDPPEDPVGKFSKGQKGSGSETDDRSQTASVVSNKTMRPTADTTPRKETRPRDASLVKSTLSLPKEGVASFALVKSFEIVGEILKGENFILYPQAKSNLGVNQIKASRASIG